MFVKGDIVSSQCTVQVNRYTEGSVSPDPMLTHKRTISNVTNMSGHSFSSEAAARLGDVFLGVLLGCVVKGYVVGGYVIGGCVVWGMLLLMCFGGVCCWGVFLGCVLLVVRFKVLIGSEGNHSLPRFWLTLH